MEKNNAIEQAVTKQVAGVVKDEMQTVYRAIQVFDSFLSTGLYDVGIELAKCTQVAMGYSVDALAHLKDGAYTESIEAANNLLNEVGRIKQLMNNSVPTPEIVVREVKQARVVSPEDSKAKRPRKRQPLSTEERRERKLARQREYNKRYAARKKAEKEASQNG